MSDGVLRVVISDDERAAIARTKRLIAGMTGVSVVATCESGADTVVTVRRERPDIVMLDVHMPDLDGFEVLRQLGGDTPPAVIIATAFESYALRAFDLPVVHYLLKPYSADRLREALERARRLVALTRRAALHAGSGNGVEPPPAPVDDRLLAVREGGRVHCIPPMEICWIEAADYYAKIHVERRVIMIRETLFALEGRLLHRGFLRVHRSAIVNLRRVRELRATGGGGHVVILDDGTRLRVTRARRSALVAALEVRI